ncbi:MAG: hypothetical protein IPN96_16495 [Anaerolineales bacterium]|nr:hypothetical protein [Anaerolineales bacterium]
MTQNDGDSSRGKRGRYWQKSRPILQEFCYDNMIMGVELMHHAHKRAVWVNLLPQVRSVLYPKFTPVPFKEDDLLDQFPEETNAPWPCQEDDAWAGTNLSPTVWLQCHLSLPVNLYGHAIISIWKLRIISALIRKAIG